MLSANYQQSVQPLSWLFSVLEILSSVASLHVVRVVPTLRSGRLCVVALLDCDPCALECSASPRPAEGVVCRCASPGGACLVSRSSCFSKGNAARLCHLFPGGSGRSPCMPVSRLSPASRARVDACAPRVGASSVHTV